MISLVLETDTMLKHYISTDTLFTKHNTASTLSKNNILASAQGESEQYKYVTSLKPIVKLLHTTANS